MKKKKNKRTQTSDRKALPSFEKGSRKAWLLLLLVLVLWSALCVALYYLSIKQQLLWVIHLYMLLSLPCLCAAVFINAYCNAKFTSPNTNEKTPDEKLVRKMRNIIKALIIIGFPPLACVLIEYIAMWLIQKF